ncbi:hypothetical protein M011DRAFT_470327 [Sporormia fimetaria CBS 119925]|uniref:2EXR domain-containing protein n=1 Tax=Sporormia fimetaria CBS 119925 TaxID=1340428 RepID=A0A6A6V5J0_9PLEO|nr:hypothetical protein M011DRAFT_470327 [Sporormia fimetaria CBS 119925]
MGDMNVPLRPTTGKLSGFGRRPDGTEPLYAFYPGALESLHLNSHSRSHLDTRRNMKSTTAASKTPRLRGGRDDNQKDIDFPLFPKLPEHIRKLIFTFATPPPRTHFVELHHFNPTAEPAPTVQLCYHPPLPALFRTCSEARYAAIEAQGGALLGFMSNAEGLQRFYFNPDYDILWLGHRFQLDYDYNAKTRQPTQYYMRVTETYMFNALEDLIPYYMQQWIRRVAVSFSGRDNYRQIANTLRWFQSLEVIYLIMDERKYVPYTTKKPGKATALARENGAVARTLMRALLKEERDEGYWEDWDEDVDQPREFIEEIRRRRRVVEVERVDFDTAFVDQEGWEWVDG